ncbi:hypothetical protein ACHQM5_000488 [Ranunculus cassubicifolius]
MVWDCGWFKVPLLLPSFCLYPHRYFHGCLFETGAVMATCDVRNVLQKVFTYSRYKKAIQCHHQFEVSQQVCCLLQLRW